MKLLTLTHWPYLSNGQLKPAGIETFFSWHMRELARNKITSKNLFVCTPAQKGAAETLHLPAITPPKIYPFAKHPVSFEHLLNIPFVRPKVEQAFSEGDFDAVHANGEIYAMYCPRPLVTHVHGTLNYANLLSKGTGSPRHFLSTLFSKKISQIAAKRSDIMVFNTKMLSDIYPFEVKKKTIPHAVDVASRPSKPPPKTKVCSVARYIPLKKLDILINWFSFYVKTAKVPAELHLIGHGPLEKELKAQAVSEGISENVFFYSLPNPSEVKRALRKMSALVSLEPAGIGYNGLEAMAEGVPIIAASNDCGCEKGAPIKHVSNAEEFLQAVESLSPSDRIRARKHIEKHHGSGQIFKMYLSAYKEAIESN